VLLLTGCGTLLRDPVPLEAQNDPSIPGFTGIRFYPLTEVEPMRKAIRQAFLTETPDNYDAGRRVAAITISPSGRRVDQRVRAAVSTLERQGNRPTFKVVTGVSTGALIARCVPGSARPADQGHNQSSREIFVAPAHLVLWERSVADNNTLRTWYHIHHARGARRHCGGARRAGSVASTNMDREEPVIWDMGAIASSKNPARLELFHSVLVASASIPAIFPPTLVKVNLDGKQYDEMHCDGGVFFQSFSIGAVVDLPALIHEAHPDYNGRVVQSLYVIRNGSTTPNRKQIPRGCISGAPSQLREGFGINISTGCSCRRARRRWLLLRRAAGGLRAVDRGGVQRSGNEPPISSRLSARHERYSLASLAAGLCPEGPGHDDRRAIACSLEGE
jgi:hypothetical protein